MINFIIYEDEEIFRDKYFSIIDKFIGESKLAHEIIELKSYSEKELKKLEKINGNKIYILDIEVPGKSGLDFAREIRNSGDWNSQIIIVTSHDNLKNFDYQSQLLMLAFISKFYTLEAKLLEAIKIAYKILTSRESIEFSKGSKIFRVPKDEILFIEKDFDEQQCFSVEKEDRELTNKTLIQWKKELEDDPRFERTHRNYIVNVHNIRAVDYEKGEIYFENNNTALLSRNYKANLKKKLERTRQM